MDWRVKVELYEQIRRKYEFGVGSVIGVARKLGVHRRMVREAVQNAVPAQRKKTERPAVKMAPTAALIDSILESDRKAPRKQRHTARRIFDRIRAEVPGCAPAERTVRQNVERRRRELGLAVHETFVPQSYDWGVEAQIDWYEAYADLDGERVKLYVFAMRSMASGAAFHRAYPCATQQAFLKAHELAFAYFEGVFRVLRYDNLTSAVKKILRGQQRELTARFIAFRSHWGYRAEFCTPGEGHAKGGVEGKAGYFRRNHWVPVPVGADLASLNRKLLADCRADESRMISGQTECVGARLLTEKEHLLPLAAEPFDLAEVSYPRVDQTGCAKVRTNSYSVPLKAGSLVEARVSSTTIEFRHDGKRIASHARCYSRLQKILDLEHYPRRARTQAGCVARIDTAGAVAGAGPMARKLRPDLGAIDRTAGTSTWHPGHGGVGPHRPRVGLHEAYIRDRTGARSGMRRCRRDPSSADLRSVAAHRGRSARYRQSVRL